MTPFANLGIALMVFSLVAVVFMTWLWPASGSWFDLQMYWRLVGGFAALGISGLFALLVGLFFKV